MTINNAMNPVPFEFSRLQSLHDVRELAFVALICGRLPRRQRQRLP